MLLIKLRKQYPDAVVWGSDNVKYDDYFWITTRDEKIGIPYKNLTPQEEQLLTILFQDSTSYNRNLSTSQVSWYNFFFNQKDLPLTSWGKIRLIYFTTSKTNFLINDFEEAILSFFNKDSILVWEDEQNGFIIENEYFNNISFEALKEIVTVIESDFYNNLQLFCGNFHETTPELSHHFKLEKESFSLAQRYITNQKIHSIKTTFPYLIMTGIESSKEWYLQELLGDMVNDSEMITTIKTYIKLNRNATLAAKDLYIHRNSLQYRIDKFIDKTNLDIRTFHDAMLAYLAILLL